MQRLRDFDWGSTPLGPIAQWPQSLKTAAGIFLVSTVPIVVLWGKDGIMIYNDAYAVFAGRRHPTLLGSKVREGWPEVADFNDHVLKVGLAGGTLTYRDKELTLYRSGTAEQVWMNLDYSPILDESGEPVGVMAIVVETTERVRAEAALRHREEQFRLAMEAAEVGLWDVDVLTDTLFWRSHVKTTFGISPDVPVSMRDFYACLHPEDREATSAAYAAACDPSRGTLYDVEYRTVGKKDGVIRWVAAKGRGVFDRSGKCVRVIGTATDITARKKIKQQLRHLNESLERQVEELRAERDRIWRHSRDLLVIAGADGIVRSIKRLQAERNVLRAGQDSLAADRDGLRAERDRLAAERDGLRADQDRLAAERDGLRADRDSLAAERDRLAAERDRLATERNALLDSTSWRLTAPIRALKKRFR